MKPLNYKAKATNVFIEYIKKEERSINKKLKCFKTNNSTEYNKIWNYYKIYGIIYSRITSYVYKQVGTAERINLTLLNKIRVILFTAKINIKF